MFNKFLFSAALCATLPIFAQTTDFTQVDAHAKSVDFPKHQDVTQLATELTTGLRTETEKARAIFVWIAGNIRYDAKLLADKDMPPAERTARQQPEMVLRTKKSVCEGYANLFTAICTAAGLKSLVATGLSKNLKGRVSRHGHAWNLVRADGTWRLIDATWGAGVLDDDDKYVEHFDDKYFFPSQQTFVRDHFPTDPLLQLLENPIDQATFTRRPTDPVPTSTNIPVLTISNPADSLNQYIDLDSASARLNRSLRILRFDPRNGEANFYIALHRINGCNPLFEVYQNNQQARVQQKTPVTLALLKTLDEQLLTIQHQLEDGQRIIAVIPVGDPYWSSAQSLRRTADRNLRICQEGLQNNATLRGKLKK